MLVVCLGFESEDVAAEADRRAYGEADCLWPEAHNGRYATTPTHPSKHGERADDFIGIFQHRGGDVVVATHSDVFVHCLCRRVRSGRLKASDLLFVWVKGDQATEITVDDDGNFTQRWPEGFFEERHEELFADDEETP